MILNKSTRWRNNYRHTQIIRLSTLLTKRICQANLLKGKVEFIMSFKKTIKATNLYNQELSATITTIIIFQKKMIKTFQVFIIIAIKYRLWISNSKNLISLGNRVNSALKKTIKRRISHKYIVKVTYRYKILRSLNLKILSLVCLEVSMNHIIESMIFWLYLFMDIQKKE